MISIYGNNREAILRRIERIDQNMIVNFFENIERLAESETSTDPNRLMFKTPDEMIEILRNEKEESEE